MVDWVSDPKFLALHSIALFIAGLPACWSRWQSRLGCGLGELWSQQMATVVVIWVQAERICHLSDFILSRFNRFRTSLNVWIVNKNGKVFINFGFFLHHLLFLFLSFNLRKLDVIHFNRSWRLNLRIKVSNCRRFFKLLVYLLLSILLTLEGRLENLLILMEALVVLDLNLGPVGLLNALQLCNIWLRVLLMTFLLMLLLMVYILMRLVN